MLDDRLPTELWVTAHLRQCTSAAVPVYVVRRGDKHGGMVMLKLNQLDADTNKTGGLLLSTDACPLFDINGNQYVDRIGAKTNPCDWNMTLTIDGKPKKMKATFYAIRQL